MRSNAIEIEGRLIELLPLRVTPGGVRVASGTLQHSSGQMEAGVEREVQAEIPFVALGEVSNMFDRAALGSTLVAKGFVAAKSVKSKKLVLHINEMRFVEGN